MIIWIRNIVVIFVLLSIVYVILSFLSKQKQRNKLEAEFSNKNIKDATKLSKSEYMAVGMRKYNKSFRPKMIFSVYLVPFVILIGLLYLANLS